MLEHDTNTQVESLKYNIGLRLVCVDSYFVRLLNSRDLDGGTYPYLYVDDHSDVSHIGFFIDEYPVGYAVVGKRKSDKAIGEILMIHLSPQMRDLHLGKVIHLLSTLELLKQDIESIYAEIGDSSGKIKHMLEEQGYKPIGVSEGAGRHEIYFRSFQSNLEKTEFLNYITNQLIIALNGLNKTKLAEQAQRTDIDNPTKTCVEQTVIERLKSIIFFKKSQNIFGYSGSLARIALSYPYFDSGQSVFVDFINISKTDLKGIHFESGFTVVDLSQGQGIRISGEWVKETDKLIEQALYLARVVDKLFSNISNE